MDEPKKDFVPPNTPPSHTGFMWRRPDGTIGIEISDVFLRSIRLIGTKEGDQYYLRGWRGRPPEEIRVPLIDDTQDVAE